MAQRCTAEMKQGENGGGNQYCWVEAAQLPLVFAGEQQNAVCLSAYCLGEGEQEEFVLTGLCGSCHYFTGCVFNDFVSVLHTPPGFLHQLPPLTFTLPLLIAYASSSSLLPLSPLTFSSLSLSASL